MLYTVCVYDRETEIREIAALKFAPARSREVRATDGALGLHLLVSSITAATLSGAT